MSRLLSPVVWRNFYALLILQGGTYLVPLLLIPYLIRALGFDLFGEWMFAMAFVVIARIFVNYGFELTATRQVAAGTLSDPQWLSQLLSNVLMARLAIWIACFLITIIASHALDQVAEIRTLLLLAMFILIGEIIFPAWLFQGKERMGDITGLRLASKLLNLILVILLVREPEDILLIPIIEALANFLSGAAALYLAKRRFGLQFLLPSMHGVRGQMSDGFHVFVSTLAVQFYTTTNVLVLGFLIGPTAVAGYALAEKVYSALRGLLSPFVQAVFPLMARIHGESHVDFSRNYSAILRTLLIVLLISGVLLFTLSGLLIRLLASQPEAQAVQALQVFAISLPFAIGSFLAPMLVVRHRNARLMRINIIGGIIGACLSPVLSWFFAAPGAAGAFLLVQVYNSFALLRANRTGGADGNISAKDGGSK